MFLKTIQNSLVRRFGFGLWVLSGGDSNLAGLTVCCIAIDWNCLNLLPRMSRTGAASVGGYRDSTVGMIELASLKIVSNLMPGDASLLRQELSSRFKGLLVKVVPWQTGESARLGPRLRGSVVMRWLVKSQLHF